MPSMRLFLALGLAGLSLASSGCALVDGVRVTTNRTKETVEDCFEWKRDLKWAEEAWLQNTRCDPDLRRSRDYGEGFREGYATYLYRDGNGEPPPLPPRHYRALKYQTPQGYKAIEDWFNGYRSGSSFARESGARELITGPTTATECGPTVCAPQQSKPTEMIVATVTPKVEPPDRVLQDAPNDLPTLNIQAAEALPVDGTPEFPLELVPERKPHARLTAVHAKSDDPQGGRPADARPEP
jgi:hypothetical protein